MKLMDAFFEQAAFHVQERGRLFKNVVVEEE